MEAHLPKQNRGVLAASIANNVLAIKSDMAKAIGLQDEEKYTLAVARLRTPILQLAALQEDCDHYSKHGYTTYSAMRRQLMLATNELEIVRLKLREAIDAPFGPSTVAMVTTCALELKRIEFNPPIRRPRPTLEDVAADQLDSVSNVKPSPPAGELGDQQLDSLKHMLGGES